MIRSIQPPSVSPRNECVPSDERQREDTVIKIRRGSDAASNVLSSRAISHTERGMEELPKKRSLSQSVDELYVKEPPLNSIWKRFFSKNVSRDSPRCFAMI